MGQDRFAYGKKRRIDLHVGAAIFVAFIFTLGVITYLLDPYPSFMPVVNFILFI